VLYSKPDNNNLNNSRGQTRRRCGPLTWPRGWHRGETNILSFVFSQSDTTICNTMDDSPLHERKDAFKFAA